MAIPFLRALRRAHPQDPLAVLASRGPAAIFRAEGSADLVLTRSGFLADVVALRSSRFEEAWLLPNSFRAAWIALLGGARQRIGYDTDRRGSLLTHALPAPPRQGHQLRDYDALLSSRGIEPDPEPPRLTVPPAAQRRATQALAEAGIPPGLPLVLFAPGAAFGWTKRWPAERFGQLADLLAKKGFARAAVIGPGEEELAGRAKASARAGLPILGADLDPVELSGVLARARLLVSNDSGPMHLASAVGTPVLAFFGPTDPGRTAPVGSVSRILDRYVFCSPCYLKTCPYGHECMKEISVEDALAAVETLLGQSS